MHLMVGASILVLAIFGLGGAGIGRLVSAKMDLQRGSDAVALGSAELLRDRGRQTMGGALQLGKANFASASFSPSNKPQELADRVIVTSLASAGMDLPVLAFGYAGQTLTSSSRAYVKQMVFNTAQPIHPWVAMVLDYSGSMSGERMAMLKQSVNEEALKADLAIDWSAVLFSDNILGQVDFQPLNPAKAKKDISDIVNAHDATSGTQTDAGLNQADEFLNKIKGQTTAQQRYVLLVSDGGPNDPGAATAAAQKIWKDTDATIITLTVGDDPSGVAWMKTVSGKGPAGNDPKWAIQASDPQTLKKKFSEIISRLGCPLAALDPKQLDQDTKDMDGCMPGNHSNCERMGGFLRAKGGGAEQQIRLIGPTESLPDDQLAFSYDKSSHTPTLSTPACKAVHDDGQEFVIRYNRAKLMP
jgi:uncharacterized protein YegL